MSNTFRGKARLKLEKNLRLDFCYLMKNIHILDPPYHPKITEHILKNKQKNKCVFKEDENEK